MTNGLESRIERLLDAVNPEPARMLTIILRVFHPADVGFDPMRYPAAGSLHHVGRYALACFVGGTERERRRELERLRKSGVYDRDPCAKAISGDKENEDP